MKPTAHSEVIGSATSPRAGAYVNVARSMVERRLLRYKVEG